MGIYPSTQVDEVEYIPADSGTRILFAEDADQAAKAANDRERLPDLMTIVVIDGPGDGDLTTLSQTQPVRAAIQETIDDLNATLNPWETIKKFTILTRDLTEARGELTTRLRVKRTVVEQHFTHQLDAMDT